MPKLLDSKDQEHLDSHESVYVSSGEVAGQGSDRWGQRPVALLTIEVREASMRALESLLESASQSVTEDDLVLEELDAWRDAAADAFWLIEESLGEDEDEAEES